MRSTAFLPLILLYLVSVTLRADILDRIALTIDHRVITESQIDEEVRVTAFLNRQPVNRTIEERRAAADRLIQQSLVEREMKLGHYPAPTSEDVQKYLDGLVESMGGAGRFAAALEQAHLNVDILKTHLELQLTALRFIEYRFRPNFEISDQEIEAYRKHASKPMSSAAIREILIQGRTDEILSAWLEETRKQVDIVYLNSELR